MVRVLLSTVLRSLVGLKIMLHLGGLSQLPKEDVPKRDLLRNMAHASNHSIPVVDEGSQIISGKLDPQEILNRIKCAKFLIGPEVLVEHEQHLTTPNCSTSIRLSRLEIAGTARL